MAASRSSWLDYLKGPELVVQVQHWFGIRYRQQEAEQVGEEEKQQLQLKQTPSRPPPPQIAETNGQVRARQVNQVGDGCHSDNSENDSDQGSAGSATDPLDRIVITNKFWYYLFLIGTELGDELFYATFIPFWFWNIDSAIGRRFVFVWAAIMYVGQSMKDIIKWSRPGPPCIQLQKKWSAEYGMPSTHAMVSISIPASILIYALDRYHFPLIWGLTILTSWCLVVCFSRIYLGMHSVLDIIVGFTLATLLLVPAIPLVDRVDHWTVTSEYAPCLVLSISILLVFIYPSSDKWTPTRGDTTLCVAVCAGIQIGAWINYQSGYVVQPERPPPYPIIWPSYGMLGLALLRIVIGLCSILATRAIGKSIAYAIACSVLGKTKTELLRAEESVENNSIQRVVLELTYKYITYGLIGLNIQYLMPNVFKLLGICRPDFYTEI